MRTKELQKYLSQSTARKVRVRLTDDRSSVVSNEPGSSDTFRVKLHGMFLEAPVRVLQALARFVREPEADRRRQVVRLYREAGLDRAGERSSRGRSVTIQHEGEFYDLKVIYDHLNQEYFGGELQAFVTWGRRRAVRGRRSIHFGSYNWERKLIRLNPLLDQYFVPR
jgi:hypothetical protein